MPIYEFTCKRCDAHFETLVKSFDAIDEVECPDCKGKDVERRLSSFNSGSSGDPASSGHTCATRPFS